MKAFEDLQSKASASWNALSTSKTRIIVGAATCGRAAGALKTLEAVRAEVARQGLNAQVEMAGCVGLCYEEPLVDIIKPGGARVTYKQVTADKVPALVEQVLVKGVQASDMALGAHAGGTGLPSLFDLPFFEGQERRLMARCGLIDPANIDHYIATGGYAVLDQALTSMKPDEIIAEVKTSYIRGRGGAAYPTGMKWEQCRAAKGSPKYVICNADEGDPGVFADRTVLESDPHAVIEGMVIASFAVGSDTGFIYIRGEYPLATEILHHALQQARERGLMGKNILGSEHSFDIQIRQGAGSYVAGESSAQMSSIEGGRAMPRLKRPRSVEKGLWGKPTSMNNVETFANIPHIVKNGGAWYASIGTEKSKGTKLFSLSGHILRTGVVEVPFGTPLGKVILGMGGGSPTGRVKGVLPGGPAGGLIPAELFDTPIDLDAYDKLGSMVGSGGFTAFDDTTCILKLARYCALFMRDESCDRCSTCRAGSQRLADYLACLEEGEGTPQDLVKLQSLCNVLKQNSHCGLGQTAPNAAMTGLKFFRQEFEDHINKKLCPAQSA
ncbi:MAG: NADH-ubiquinone oxidoreductase-F iron-sulfur binding region domain-containing protein [Dehalococcoidia bacterium]|nr:NADH-ubiquinone oxidoreductase-F iron-sulfur binding region domain-containing protein [Dehalococcoidia bacterium]